MIFWGGGGEDYVLYIFFHICNQQSDDDGKGPGPGLLAAAANDALDMLDSSDAPIGGKGVQGRMGQRGPYVRQITFD